MPLDLTSGWIQQARVVPSPNCDQREHQAKPEAIIIHSISLPPGQYDNDCVEQFFCNKLDRNQHDYFNEIANLIVSSHFYIKRKGELIQFVATSDRAWHAGESCCLGKPAANNFTIGIELQGLDTDTQGFTDAQYNKLKQLIETLKREYPDIKENNIFAHSDIAPGRKTDPGPYFDWNKVLG